MTDFDWSWPKKIDREDMAGGCSELRIVATLSNDELTRVLASRSFESRVEVADLKSNIDNCFPVFRKILKTS